MADAAGERWPAPVQLFQYGDRQRHVLDRRDAADEQQPPGQLRARRVGGVGAEEGIVEAGRQHERPLEGGIDRAGQFVANPRAHAHQHIGPAHRPALEGEHQPAKRPREGAEPVAQHQSGDVVVGEDDAPAPRHQHVFGPGGVVAVEVEDVVLADAVAVSPEPAPAAQPEADEAGPARDVFHLRRLASVLQARAHQAEGQAGDQQRPVQGAEVLGTAALIAGERIVVVEDVDHGTSPRRMRAARASGPPRTRRSGRRRRRAKRR